MTLANRRQVDPEPDDLRRIAREQDELARAFSTYSDFESDGLAFDLPAAGRISGGFGSRMCGNSVWKDAAAPENKKDTVS